MVGCIVELEAGQDVSRAKRIGRAFEVIVDRARERVSKPPGHRTIALRIALELSLSPARPLKLILVL
jgi:hypothetical protein